MRFVIFFLAGPGMYRGGGTLILEQCPSPFSPPHLRHAGEWLVYCRGVGYLSVRDFSCPVIFRSFRFAIW